MKKLKVIEWANDLIRENVNLQQITWKDATHDIITLGSESGVEDGKHSFYVVHEV